MTVASPADGYKKCIQYADHKLYLSVPQFMVQSFMAGLWVAVYGHCCTVASSGFFDGTDSHVAKVVYGLLFPGAFVAVAFTGTELFTGNTAVICLYTLNNFHSKDFFKICLRASRVLLISYIGNFIGAVFGAFMLSYLSDTFKNQQCADFLNSMADHKTYNGFFPNLLLAIGCNMLVCLATWTTVIIGDGAGKILAMWFTVAVFAMGGFEHIVANFYTLSLAWMLDTSRFPFFKVLAKNWIPVTIGNMIAGFILTGSSWWFALSPRPDHHYNVEHKESNDTDFGEKKKSQIPSP